MSEPTVATTPSSAVADPRSVKIIAKSVYRELVTNGHSQSDIVAFTNAMLELVTSDMREEGRAA